MSFWDDFRQGLDEARAARAARIGGNGSVPQAGGYYEPIPYYQPAPQDFSEPADWGGGAGWGGVGPAAPPGDDPRLEQLATLCEQQQGEIARHQADLAAIGGRLDGFVAAVAERDGAIAALREELEKVCATRDRYQSSGKKLLAEMAQWRSHIAAIEKLGWHAASKAAHPDTAPEEQRPAREELFKLVKTIFGRK